MSFSWLRSLLSCCCSTYWPAVVVAEIPEGGGCLLLTHLFVGYLPGLSRAKTLKHNSSFCRKLSSVIVVLCSGLLPYFCSLSVNNVLKLQGWKAMFVESLFVLKPVQGTVSLCQFADVEIATA